MSSRYRLSSVAETDIESIVRYIAADNLTAAVRMIDRFTEAFELLASHRELGERCSGRATNLRRFTVGSYLVFYQTFDEEIVVARVVHGARQWEHLI
jgi:toxin ParE1/3/4